MWFISWIINIKSEKVHKIEISFILVLIVHMEKDLADDVVNRIAACWLKWSRVSGVLCYRRMPIKLNKK